MRSYEILELLREAVEAKDGCEPAARAFVLMAAMEPTADVTGLNAFIYFNEAKAALFESLQNHAEGEPWQSEAWDGFDFVPKDPSALCAKAWGCFELYVKGVQDYNEIDN